MLIDYNVLKAAASSIQEKLYLEDIDLKILKINLALANPLVNDVDETTSDSLMNDLLNIHGYSTPYLTIDEELDSNIIFNDLSAIEKYAFYTLCYQKYMVTINQEIGQIIHNFLNNNYYEGFGSPIRYITSLTLDKDKIILTISFNISDNATTSYTSAKEQSNLTSEDVGRLKLLIHEVFPYDSRLFVFQGKQEIYITREG